MIEVEMKLARETKRTYRYEDDSLGTPITTLYVAKGTFQEGAPESITVKVD